MVPLAVIGIPLETTLPSAAVPINLDFSFGGVSGTFLELDKADGTLAATSYDFFGVLDSYLNFTPSPLEANSFTFSNGALTEFDFAHALYLFLNGEAGIGSLESLVLNDLQVLAQEWETIFNQRR